MICKVARASHLLRLHFFGEQLLAHATKTVSSGEILRLNCIMNGVANELAESFEHDAKKI
jgi:hypothetical protein